MSFKHPVSARETWSAPHSCGVALGTGVGNYDEAPRPD